MAIDVNGNYVPDFGGMSQWGNVPQTNLSSSIVPQTTAGDFGSSTFNVNSINPTAGQNNSLFSSSSLFGGTDAAGNQTSGWAAPALGAASGLAQSWLGFQNLGVARDQLNFQRNAWQEQFNIQKEEYEYQKARRDERMQNYRNSLNGAAQSPTV